MILTGRLYDNREKSGHFRILVDRLWPRGISKGAAFWDEWLKDVAPSNELRKWFSHDPAKWTEFRKRYLEELLTGKDEAKKILDSEKKYGSVILLYGTRNVEFNHTIVLKDYLKQLKNEEDRTDRRTGP
jgi:uncharacterized protein YeaO (DUF488 family)